MSKKLWDVIIVGGGPAGITAALRLAREPLDVLVVEAAVYPGAENWSGAVYFAENLADPDVLGAEELLRAPYERRVVKRGFFSCNGPTLAGAEYRDPETFQHCYTVLRPVYDRYLAEQARARGVTFLNETTVDGLIRRGPRVIGVHTDRGPVYGELVFLAEGDAAHLVSKEGFERDVVRSKPSRQPAFLQGVKEVIALDPRVIEERFGVEPGEAACYEVLLRNGAIDNRPHRLNMAGFIYTNRSSVSIGLVLPLENLTALKGDYNALMEWYKGLPPIRRLIAGGESTSYGAKIIRGGGVGELPQLVDDGVAIGGAATGIGVDFPYPNFTGPACAMGKLFAEAALELRREGVEPERERLEESYVERLKATHYYKDVEHLRAWPAFIEHSDALFTRQIDLLNGSLYVMTRPGLSFGRKWWETVRLVGETMKGKWVKTLRDLSGGSKALGIGRFALKHALPALLLSLPNTLLGLLPFAWGRGRGRLSFSFWVKDEETGRLPWFKRWLGARMTPALSKAAAVLYANNDQPLARKLSRGVGLVMRRLSLWEVLGVFVGVAGFALTRAVQRLTDALRFALRRPTLQELMATFYGRWLARWRAETDLSAAAAKAAKSHDAKLGEISYASDHGSHIKVFFPPSQPGALEDPSASALWGVCPAAVYQINLDRTMHASVTVNFENCIKCESCWRIEPQHVDWSRFGKHRLIYEVYTEADGALHRILAERDLGATPEIEASFWTATLADDWSGDGVTPAPDTLKQAWSEARRAIDRAVGKCSELHDNVWHGPRVLEPGQVIWYESAIEYFAYLAEEAAAAATAAPLESWLVERELNAAHSELLLIKRDLESLAHRLREHAGARRFFAAEADARQIRDHHLDGLRACLDRIADGGFIESEPGDPIAELRALEIDPPDRAAARERLRERLAEVFDRQAVRRLEHGGVPEGVEVELLRSAARAAAGLEAAGGDFDAWGGLKRDDIMQELARLDPSLSIILASHLAAVDALTSAGAPASLLDPLKRADRFATVALEAPVEEGNAGWSGRTPFVPMALADTLVTAGGGRLAAFERGSAGVSALSTPAIGLIGAAIHELHFEGARPTWEGDWDESAERALFARRARDVGAIALGAGSHVTERAIDHARSRIQFPDMFQDTDGRDAVGKFGAVRAHIAHVEAGRLAVETLLRDVPWQDETDGLEATVAKVAVTDLFGPDMPSITYRAGQVIGGTAFSEDDIFSKLYRDSSVFPHYIRENARLNVEIGKRLANETTSLLGTISPDLDATLSFIERRPIFDFEVRRLREAEAQLQDAMRRELEKGNGSIADHVVHDITGELATRLYVWARALVRAHRRIEAALPAERFVEAARLWADTMEERLVAVDRELAAAADRVELGGYAFGLEGYPDVPIATTAIGFDYSRDIIKAERKYRSGDFLLKPYNLKEARYLPELVWADDVTRSNYEEYLRLFRERFVEGGHDPSYDRFVERLHYIPRADIDWTQRQGYFRVVIPQEYGGQGRSKADYYSLCMISKRLADVSHTLTIQGNTSIGTHPILFGLQNDVAAAERDLQSALGEAERVEGFRDQIVKLLATRKDPDIKGLEAAFTKLNKEIGAKLGRSRILKKVVFGKFLSSLQKAGVAGMKRDLDGFFGGLEKAASALEGWRERAQAELDEMPRRRFAHEFYLRLISARMISAFALTEPSAGSDTARIRTEARLDSRRVLTDEDGVKHFFLDEHARKGRRNIADMRRFEFDYDNSKIFYRYRDDAPPAEILSQEYTYEAGEERYRYYTVGDRRVDIHDMALIRERDGQEIYEFYVLNGAKMWITNGHIAGVEALYARTPAGVTGFMVDALTEGFLVGKDEEKTGQRGSPTNEITLTNVRVPRECLIGIEGRGQENALETLNVGRAGLCISAAAGMQQKLTDVVALLSKIPRGSEGWVRYRLGLALEEMFATEAIAHNLIGLFDDKTSDALRMESSIGKLFGTDGAHRMDHYLEPLYEIEGQTQRFRIEKDRRDDRVLTIYEGTNEIQQFLLLKDLVDMVGPKIDQVEGLEIAADDTPFSDPVRALCEMHAGLQARLKLTRQAYKSAAWQRALLQPIFFRLAQMTVLVKLVDSAIHRAHWITQHLSADGDSARRGWTDRAARGFVARSEREFARLASGLDRDLEILKGGGRTAELALAETIFDEADAAPSAPRHVAPSIDHTPIERPLELVVVLELAPRLAPRPRLEDGRVSEHLYGFAAGARRALRLALALKSAAPGRVHITLVCAGPRTAEDGLRFGLAAGADRAILLDTRGEAFAEHAVSGAFSDVLRARRVAFDLLFCDATEDGPTGGRTALRLADEHGGAWMPDVLDLWVAGDRALYTSARFPGTVRTPMPAVAGVAATKDEPEWQFGTSGFARALRKPLEVVPFPSEAERSDEVLAAAGAAAAAEQGVEGGSIEPERAADVLVEIGDLGDGASAPAAGPYRGVVREAATGALDWTGVAFVAELENDELARDARAPLLAAQSIAARAHQPLNVLVLTAPLDDARRRNVAGQLAAMAPFTRIVFAEHPAMASDAPMAYAEALIQLLGPSAGSRPAYLLSSPWLAEALPLLADALRDAQVSAEELSGVSRVEFRDGDGVAFIRPVHERRLRARSQRPTTAERMRILWCEPEVAADGGELPEAETEVLTVPLALEFDPQTDELARALADAKRALGVVTLENAEFVIDVGAGLGSVDNLETVVEPLRQTLLALGAPHVHIGATRKVTMDMSWLPDEHQIGQTGVRVNPRVLIALGVSGAPQHIDYVGDRAVIFAFNMDPQAPLMTLNQRREQPKVYPVVGDLFKTVPKFIAALKGRAGREA